LAEITLQWIILSWIQRKDCVFPLRMRQNDHLIGKHLLSLKSYSLTYTVVRQHRLNKFSSQSMHFVCCAKHTSYCVVSARPEVESTQRVQTFAKDFRLGSVTV